MQTREKNFSHPEQYLWTDLPDALQRVAAAPRATPAVTLNLFIDQGYAVLPGGVTDAAVDLFLRDTERLFADPGSGILVEYWGPQGKRRDIARAELLNKPEAKVLDLHSRVPSSQALIFSKPLLGFLRDVFQDEPVAFQSLYFEYGSQQPVHNDTAFVPVDPSSLMVASWIALENIVADSGELFFYTCSQRVCEQVFANGGKAFDPSDPQAEQYSQTLESIARRFNLKRVLFRPRKGDALFWAADLFHGGEKTSSGHTRRSLVTHYCPLRASVPYARAAGKKPSSVVGGGYILSDLSP
jgi:hypothetical protein